MNSAANAVISRHAPMRELLAYEVEFVSGGKSMMDMWNAVASWFGGLFSGATTTLSEVTKMMQVCVQAGGNFEFRSTSFEGSVLATVVTGSASSQQIYIKCTAPEKP